MSIEDSTNKNIEGQRLFQEGQYEEARQLFSEAIKADPENPAAWLNRAETYRKLGKDKEADDDRERWLALRQSQSEAVAATVKTTKETIERRPLWGRGTLIGVSLFGGWPAAGVVAGINWRRMGRPQLLWPTIIISIVAYVVFAFVPWPGENYYAEIVGRLICVGVAGWGLWRWQKPYYERLMGQVAANWLVPVAAVIVMNIIAIGAIYGLNEVSKNISSTEQGMLYQSLGDYDEAIEKYTLAIEENPENAAAYANRALAYFASMDISNSPDYLDNALADLEKAIELDPNNPEYLMVRAEFMFNFGSQASIKGAIEDITRVIALTPENDQELLKCYLARSQCYYHIGEYETAAEDADKAIILDASYAPAYQRRGLAYLNYGRYQEAASDFSQEIELNASATAYLNRGLTYLFLFEDKMAEQDFETAYSMGIPTKEIEELKERVFNAR